MDLKSNLGLVLSGGGAKGSYQIGVWKALIELGIDKQVKAVSGTSVGALNGALFCQGNYETAEKVWLGISKTKILTPDLRLILRHTAVALKTKGGIARRLLSLGRSIYDNGIFSRDGLIEIFDEYLNPELIKNSDIPLYVCTLNTTNNALNTVKLNTRSSESIRSFLLATSAIPAIFKKEPVGEQLYLDGGIIPFLKNKTPFEVLIQKEKCKRIILVFLDTNPDLRIQKKYPEVEFINIFPKNPFIGRIASLNFSPQVSEKLLQRGYEDGLELSSLLRRQSDIF